MSGWTTGAGEGAITRHPAKVVGPVPGIRVARIGRAHDAMIGE